MIKVFREEVPAMRFIGKKYPDFGGLWGEWFANGTCWLYGKEDEVHDTGGCADALQKQGIKLWKDSDGGVWSFENCLCPRYTTPDEKGNVILDYCYYAE